MRKSLGTCLFCLIGITVLIAWNRWDLPIAMWLCVVFVVVGFVTGVFTLAAEWM